jgi:hypothetical protein
MIATCGILVSLSVLCRLDQNYRICLQYYPSSVPEVVTEYRMNPDQQKSAPPTLKELLLAEQPRADIPMHHRGLRRRRTPAAFEEAQSGDPE